MTRGACSSQLTPTSANFSAKQGLALPSLVLFRQGNRGPEHQAMTLLGNLEEVAEDLLMVLVPFWPVYTV